LPWVVTASPLDKVADIVDEFRADWPFWTTRIPAGHLLRGLQCWVRLLTSRFLSLSDVSSSGRPPNWA